MSVGSTDDLEYGLGGMDLSGFHMKKEGNVHIADVTIVEFTNQSI